MRISTRTAMLLTCVLVVGASEVSSARKPAADSPRLVSFEPYEDAGASCAWDDTNGVPAGQLPTRVQDLVAPLLPRGADVSTGLVARLQQAPEPGTSRGGRQAAASTEPAVSCAAPGCDQPAAQKPIRTIQDPYPAFSAVTLDLTHNEVVLNDENKFNVFVYDRLTNTPANAPKSEPKRVIGGPKTHINLSSAAYVDPKNGDIYVVNTDSLTGIMEFGRDKQGNVQYDRFINAPFGTYGVAMDEVKEEMFVTVQHDSAITVWPKNFQTDPKRPAPIRLIQGPRTHMADPHGIAFDAKNRLLYVVNYGNSYAAVPGTIGGYETAPGPRLPNYPSGSNPVYRHEVVIGSGKFGPPSVTVYPADAQGNAAALRIIEGPKTQMNWPSGVAVDPDHGEVYVSNDVGDDVLVFSATAQGDVAPIRVIKGSHTRLKNPTGLAFDPVNEELWVANYGSHEATVYKRTASGDAAPIRAIRNAPAEEHGTLFSNPFTVAYDAKRDEILVGNCVGQPRIAAFEKLADKDALPVRKIEGTKTLMSRTVHSMQYDAIHDEVVVNQNITGAILTFRGAADGEEPPIRVIQGPNTMLRDPEKVMVDPVHQEYYVFNLTSGGVRNADKIMVFDGKATGDVAPIRVITSPGTVFTTGVIDAADNLLIVGGRIKDVGTRVMFFDRTANGSVMPKRLLGGPKNGPSGTSVMALYPPTGKLVILGGAGDGDTGGGGAFAGVWNVTDVGDVPPQYTVGKGMLAQVRGMALDTKAGNIVISDKELEAVFTFALPQMFKSPGGAELVSQARQQ